MGSPPQESARRSVPRGHIPVLHTTVLSVLAPQKGQSVLDVTLGLGGHAQGFLDLIGPSGRFTGLDADPRNLELAAQHLRAYDNARLLHVNFRNLAELELQPVDVLFADLGLSSPHIDDPARGFMFRSDAPLDMRFDPTAGATAAQLIRRSTPDSLFEIFRTFGQFPGGARLARMLAGTDVPTTFALKAVVESAFGYKANALLPQVFQALRIAVNDELGALAALLQVGPRLLQPGGRMGVISYHSLEDRLVKQAFRSLADPARDPVTGKVIEGAPFHLLTRKAIVPDAPEIAENPRARSAKFRAITRRVSS